MTTTTQILTAQEAPKLTFKSTPDVPYLQNTASVAEIVAAIKVARGCVIKNAVSTEALDSIELVSTTSFARKLD